MVPATPELDYSAFTNWDVVGGSVDLIGAGLYDFLPGNGLYVDLSGTTLPGNGRMVTKTPISLTAGDSYRLSLDLAGNQRVNLTPFSVTVKVFSLSGATEVVALSQVITINDHTQDFHPYSYTFTALASMDVYISIQQTTVPAGSEYFGLLLNSVTFDNVTDSVNLFTENFDGENMQYVPPRCGLASTYYNGQYAYGYNCYGEGCLDAPVPIQAPDPNPLPNIESGSVTPTTFTSTRTKCASCGEGMVNAPADNLVPVMTGYGTPSGLASASYGPIVGYEAWKAFDQDDDTMWISPIAEADPIWLAYTFPAAQSIGQYALSISRYGNGNLPKAWVFEGSSDGATWTSLDTRTDESWAALVGEPERKLFHVSSPISCRYYRIRFTEIELPGSGVTTDIIYLAVVGLELFGGTTSQTVCKTATATSTLSQDAADAAADAAALALAEAELDCAQAWTRTETAIATCEYGTVSASASASYTSYISDQDARDKAYAAALVAATALLDCTQSTNEHSITMPATNWNDSGYGPATPFPSVKYIAESATIGTVVVTLTDILPCANGNSWNIFLTSPAGTTVLLWSDQGTTQLIDTQVTISLADGSPAMPVAPASLAAGTYAPNNGGVDPVLTIPATAPQPPYSMALSAFAGEDQQGAWALWVVLRTNAASKILGGWDLTIT